MKMSLFDPREARRVKQRHLHDFVQYADDQLN
jgi:hypothetical protein